MSAGQNAVMPVMQMQDRHCGKAVIVAPRPDNLVKAVIAVLDTAIYLRKRDSRIKCGNDNVANVGMTF